MGRPGGRRSPAPGGLARIEPAHADARRGRPAAARRASPRRRLPGAGRVTASRVEPQGVDRRPVRDALRDVRPDARHRRGHLVGRRRGRRGGPGTTGRPALPLHGLPRPARRLGAAPGAARCRRPAARDGGCRGGRDARLPSLAFPRHRRRGDAHRRAARPAHAAPARRPRRDPRADRGGPAGRPGPRRASSRPAPLDPAGQPPGDRSGASGQRARLVRPRPAAERDPVPRTQPVARLRGRVPGRARVHPAPRERDRRADPGAAGRGSPEPRGGDRDRGPRARQRERAAAPARRSDRLWPDGADPARPAGPRSATHAPNPGSPRRRLPRDGVGARPRGGRPPADRRAGRVLAATAVELAGGRDRARPRGGGTIDGA